MMFVIYGLPHEHLSTDMVCHLYIIAAQRPRDRTQLSRCIVQGKGKHGFV